MSFVTSNASNVYIHLIVCSVILNELYNNLFIDIESSFFKTLYYHTLNKKTS